MYVYESVEVFYSGVAEDFVQLGFHTALKKKPEKCNPHFKSINEID
jgi:hypothetical protein